MHLMGAKSKITFIPCSDWRIRRRTVDRDRRGCKVVGFGWVRLLVKDG